MLFRDGSSNGASAAAGGATTDADSRAWLARLAPGARERDAAIAELHGLLLKAARFTLAKRGTAVRDRRERLDDLATEAADDALLAVLAHLGDFRGESRFTTWAWKFAIIQTSVALRRREWATRELPAEDGVWAIPATDGLEEVHTKERSLHAPTPPSNQRSADPQAVTLPLL